MAAPMKSQSARAASAPRVDVDAPESAPYAVDVIALTTSDDFLLELGQCLEGMASIAPVETPALALAAASASRRVRVFVVDSRDCANLRAEIDRLQRQAPEVATLVFAPQEVETTVAAALKGSSAFAVLPLPIDARKTAAIFEGAAADAEARHGAARLPKDAAGAPDAPAAEPAAAAAEPPRGRGATGGGSPAKLALAAAACLVVASAAAWFLMRDDSTTPAGSPPAAATGAPAPDTRPVDAEPAGDISVDELLEKARVAMRERRYVEPAGDSALLHYGAVVKADPGNAEALDGLSRLRPLIAERFDDLQKAGSHDAAGAALAQFQGAFPDDPAIPEMRLRLASARVTDAIESGDAARAAELVRAALAAGTVPAPQLARWRTGIAALGEKEKQQQLAERQAREAAAAQKAREAKSAAAAREAQAAREREAAQKLEAQRAEQAAAAAARAAEAGSAAGASLRVEPVLKRNVRPTYPAGALERGVSGSVTVTFIVDEEGKTRDVRAESSEPPGVFDLAATSAVRRWRFEPATLDGLPTESQQRVVIRFELPE
jgi:protein TonB